MTRGRADPLYLTGVIRRAQNYMDRLPYRARRRHCAWACLVLSIKLDGDDTFGDYYSVLSRRLGCTKQTLIAAEYEVLRALDYQLFVTCDFLSDDLERGPDDPFAGVSV